MMELAWASYVINGATLSSFSHAEAVYIFWDEKFIVEFNIVAAYQIKFDISDTNNKVLIKL